MGHNNMQQASVGKGFTFSTLLASSVHDLKNILGAALESVAWLSDTTAGLTDEQSAEFKKVSRLLASVNSCVFINLNMNNTRCQSQRIMF